MRIEGYTLQEIADKLDYKSHECVRWTINAYYKKYPRNPDEWRGTTSERNDAMIGQLYNHGQGTPIEAILGILKLQHQNGVVCGAIASGGGSGTTINNVVGAIAGATAAARGADWEASGVAGELRALADDSRRVNAEDCTPALEAGPEGGDPSGNGQGSPSQGPTPGAFSSVPGIADD